MSRFNGLYTLLAFVISINFKKYKVKKYKLVSMVEFIKNFDKKNKFEINDIDYQFSEAVHKYAKLLDTKLTVEMFMGKNPLFPDFNIQIEDKWQSFYKGIRVYQFGTKNDFSYVFRKKETIRIKDMIGYDVYYNRR